MNHFDILYLPNNVFQNSNENNVIVFVPNFFKMNFNILCLLVDQIVIKFLVDNVGRLEMELKMEFSILVKFL